MQHSIHLCWLAFLILILLGYLHCRELFKSEDPKLTEEELEDEDSLSISNIYVKKNKQDLKKYKKRQQETIGGLNFPFGYSELNNVNPETVGFCPLGYHFNNKKGKFTGKTEDVFTKCKKCFDCQQQQGYYVSGGCIGNKDVLCEGGKVPFNIFIRSHSNRNPLHINLPRFHSHKLLSGAPSYDSHQHF